MTDPTEVNRICVETGASPEEALYYLEGYDWNLATAMESCRVKTLPSVKVKSSPEVSVNEQFTAADSSATPSTPPRSINYPSRSSNQIPPRKRIDSRQVLNPAKELSSELKQERIVLFQEVAPELPPQEVLSLLERFNWDVERAGDHYCNQRYSQRTSYDDDWDLPEIDQSSLQGFQEGHMPMIGVSNLEKFSKDETSTALAMDLMDHSAPPLPSLHLPSLSQFHASVGYQIGNFSSSGLMNVDVDEMGDLHDVPIMSSSQEQIQGSSCSAQNKEDHPPPYNLDRICSETGVCRDEALYYLESFDSDLATAIEACRSKTLPPLKVRSSPVVSVNEISAVPEWESPTARPLVMNSRRISNEMRIQPEQLPPKIEELSSGSNAAKIKDFCDIVGTHPDVAVAYLDRCKWHVQDAINYFMDEGELPTTGFSEDVTSNPPVPLIGLPSQSQFQASRSSSPSLMNIDPTRTEESLRDGSDESVTVANLPMVSSQVNNKLKGNAVEEDSCMETFHDPLTIQDRKSVGHEAAPTTITLTIYLTDGGSVIPVDIPFRSDQTVRDIRNAIDERTPDNDRDYYLQSVGGEDDCRDMNATVGKICKSGFTTLHQVLHD
ncbi:UBA-like superfamily [Arabidopsis thaliana x Arabidopsis arenosa]|uniref:UBA-like superfamily n=1 Tax=Arabidopsis thaliana x Arabidopsis arenosa TaxID=1240361 RepID=A0A8T2A6I6_9BRAS|nr:UBA-like superfamily [Arabidopsis thaliana x Arabidopsis arenosa]